MVVADSPVQPLVARQPQPLDERADPAGADPGLEQRTGTVPRRVVGPFVDQPATLVLGAAGRDQRRCGFGCRTGLQSSTGASGISNLRRVGASSDPGLDSIVHGVFRHWRSAETGGVDQGHRGAGDPAHTGRCARCTTKTARSRRRVAPAQAPVDPTPGAACRTAGIHGRCAPRTGRRLDFTARC
ncbi:hypothetical protein D9M73_154180 [compost metagenome]